MSRLALHLALAPSLALALGCADQAYRERLCQSDSDDLDACLALREECYRRAAARAPSSSATGPTSASEMRR